MTFRPQGLLSVRTHLIVSNGGITTLTIGPGTLVMVREGTGDLTGDAGRDGSKDLIT